MTLPETIRVKLSSEAAEYVSLTPVVVQEMPVRELVEHMLGLTGKDEARVRDLLLRGTLVSGASRFRWTGLEVDLEGVRALLDGFPNPEPARPFAVDRCVRAVLRGPRQPIRIAREAGSFRGIMARITRRPTFWDLVMELALSGELRYSDYSYRDRADVYRLSIDPVAAQRLRDAARLLRFSALEAQIRVVPIESLDLYVLRPETQGR